MNHFSLPRNLVLSVLLAGLLGACATRQQRETAETPPPPPEPPAQKSSPAPESAADSETVAEQTASADQADESGEQQLPAQTAEDVAQNSADDTGERAVAENRPLPAPTGGDDEIDQPAADAGGETETVPAGGASAEAAHSSDQRFREAMQRFDRRLARERFGTEQRDDAAAGGGGGMAGGTDEGEQAGSSGSGNPFEVDGQETEHASGTSRGGTGERNTHSPPPGTPDGHDDDIVARQLREAAESEPDPELRERLWEEYRAYKNDQE